MGATMLEHLTEGELSWLGVSSKEGANPSDLNDLGILRQDLDVLCPGKENIRAVKLYPRGDKLGRFVVQVELPNRFESVCSSGDEYKTYKLAKDFVASHCQMHCRRGRACMKKSS